MKKQMKRLLKWGAIPVVAVLVWTAWSHWGKEKKAAMPAFRTGVVTVGDLQKTISASGTVEPEELVDVGAQVNGPIVSFGKDASGKEVDYGAPVTEGMVLAVIDDAIYTASLRQADAAVMQAKANLMNARAQKIQLQAKMTLAKNNYDRSVRLRPENAIAESEYDSAKAEYDAAAANLNAADSAIAQAEAQIASAEASRDSARRNLEYCTIKSPVQGVIIDRRVNIGQTVVSSMSASSLFLIAKDLKKMEIWVSVNEADIGNIFVGQKAQFKVDAFPGRVFYGKVCKIRLNASMSQNVVTYVVEVATDNTDGKLLPYLTANVEFVLAERQNVTLVPAAALRYMPDETLVQESQKALYQERLDRKARTVWTLRDGKLFGIKVNTGLSNGLQTEIIGGDLKAGESLITGIDRGAVMMPGKAGGGSPFMPKPPQRKNQNRAQQSQREKNAAAGGF